MYLLLCTMNDDCTAYIYHGIRCTKCTFVESDIININFKTQKRSDDKT